MNEDYNKAVKILSENNQEEIIEILNKVDNEKKEKLIKQILTINFEQLNELYEMASKKPEILEKKIEHAKYVNKDKLSEEEKKKYISMGEDVIKNNQYAVVTMAGGQGTRLGHKGPKGTFKLNVEPEPKYLFQILAESLIRTNKKYNVTLHWYIMTSTENNADTVEFFENNNYFGYNKNYIKFFMQGNLPLMFNNGKLVVDKDYSIKIASDGNGCIYKSMKRSGIFEDMENNKIKWIFIGSVDNALVNMTDPCFIGLTISENNQIASKSVAKKDPTEKVGVFCKANGVPSTIEYSELPKELSELRDKDGELLYGEANIICHLYTIDALKKIAEKSLDYHVAVKKTNYMDKDDKFIEVTEPNAYKFESFVFDAFKFFDDMSILRVKREENFAPVKNKEGNDSPETAIKLYNEYWRNR